MEPSGNTGFSGLRERQTNSRVEERGDVPARYVFNQAEQHIMGLAWFLFATSHRVDSFEQ
jgi:hypothetical protein